VSEEIEQNMLLMGGTAIEDRLQEGVPETIAELAKSGIKLWVLTGDKTETAINIGFACNLLTTDMELLILRSSNRVDTAQLLQDTLDKLNKEESAAVAQDKKYALVIDGTTLKYALENATRDKVLALGMRCASVICCRVSPKQKAQVVNLVKKGLKVMTLAIGDGANDVSMIQEANVGIGISGVEGRQAVMASDYAIAQFRFLRKLLLVHGRWSYLRTAEMIMGFFFKNIVWTFVLFWYQIFCQ
jgi:phospholipid-translocating ATPase